MPSILTHCFFAEDVKKELEYGSFFSLLQKHDKLYQFASNGPDLFFFYGFWPWVSKKEADTIKRYGSLLHTYLANELFTTLFAHVKESGNEEEIACVCGIICHWALDSTIHPFVYSVVGKGTKKNSMRHRQLERTWDGELLVKRGMSRAYCPCDKLLRDETSLRPLHRLYDTVITELWQTKLPFDKFRKAVKDYDCLERLLYDPNQWKRPLLEFAETLVGRKGYISTMIINQKNRIPWDIRNAEGQKWVHPVTNEIHTESLEQLYDIATKKAVGLITLLERYLQQTASRNQIEEFVRNRSFSTDTEDTEMRYFSLRQSE
ncbi:MAG: zinc dependent phospholipase C family protein [Erysipelotrichaceae bacterium]|nr:zinc dependent phospholipase C family protein [Erysipelotrichaceae bacterium]